MRRSFVVLLAATALCPSLAYAQEKKEAAPQQAPPAEPTTNPARVHKDSAAQESLLLKMALPMYPHAALKERLSGIVKLNVIVSKDGTVASLEATKGHPTLVKSALDAVRQWRYQPTVIGGVPVEVDTTVTFIFSVEHGGSVKLLPSAEAPSELQPEQPRIRQGSDVTRRNLINPIAPVYPPEARAQGIQGRVTLRAIIGKDGSVRQLEVVSGIPILVTAAMDAVRQWTYRPTVFHGERVEVDTTIDVIFTLN